MSKSTVAEACAVAGPTETYRFYAALVETCLGSALDSIRIAIECAGLPEAKPSLDSARRMHAMYERTALLAAQISNLVRPELG